MLLFYFNYRNAFHPTAYRFPPLHQPTHPLGDSSGRDIVAEQHFPCKYLPNDMLFFFSAGVSFRKIGKIFDVRWVGLGSITEIFQK